MNAGAPQEEIRSQRELRNESGRVRRAVAEGHAFVLTNRGVPISRIVPLDAASPTLPIVRPAKRTGGWAALGPEQIEHGRTMAQTADELRGDRV